MSVKLGTSERIGESGRVGESGKGVNAKLVSESKSRVVSIGVAVEF